MSVLVKEKISTTKTQSHEEFTLKMRLWRKDSLLCVVLCLGDLVVKKDKKTMRSTFPHFTCRVL